MKQEPDHRTGLLNVRAGLLAAAGWGAAGAMAAAAIVAGLDWRVSYIDTAAAPILGCGAVLASAGWAAYAPRPAQRFGASLLAVVAGATLLWILLACVELTPRRQKSSEHPVMYPSEAISIVLPPLLTAAALSAVWSGGDRRADRGH